MESKGFFDPNAGTATNTGFVYSYPGQDVNREDVRFILEVLRTSLEPSVRTYLNSKLKEKLKVIFGDSTANLPQEEREAAEALRQFANREGICTQDSQCPLCS
jgi:hypothetical protein